MLYPGILPLVTMFDALFKDAAASQRKLKVFWIAFFWLVTCHLRGRRGELDLPLFELMAASFSGRSFPSGCSHFSQGCQYFVLPIQTRKISREFLEAPMEMKDLVYCRSVSTGSIFQEVRVSPKI